MSRNVANSSIPNNVVIRCLDHADFVELAASRQSRITREMNARI